ncbi:hypothetical protein [Micromonospora parathelypteridis]|uniref:Uncharacterized protein n=1 Tax=Micromonospora parathelypteridis TaxID=1839617 RepID=A0A840VWA4_9ACTN|nr:hypothetical protein [Micromonospora parathelypteridis]MBB5478184.1 hypothetical protein [Micromonospora parathelypteridis]GGO07571.1 hypothetical protein GCM10011576_12250 [Micromonospora parathelypteridis]
MSTEPLRCAGALIVDRPVHTVELVPHRIAGLLAPAVDRVFRAGMLAGRDGGGAELSQRYGGTAATGFLVDLRTRLAAPGGTVDGPGFAAITRYGDPLVSRRVVDKQVAYGMLHRHPNGGLSATDRGAAFLTELYQVHAEVTEELWAGQDERVLRLVAALGRVLAYALVLADEEGDQTGTAFAAMAPPYEPDGTPSGVLLLNRLGTLRYHRADAHAAAWTAAGHTASSIAALPPGPERVAIELETDRRAAGPYAALGADERLTMLADLAALPG